MDSLTQIVLGAAVGEATLGKKIGRKAAAYGAFFGTLPDLDVLWVKNAVDSFTEHRSFSHSLLVLLIVSPVFAWLLRRWHPFEQNSTRNDANPSSQIPISFWYYFVSIYAILATHALLDWQTIYGTQLFWPLTTYPLGLGSVFIIDPVYTLPFLLCLLLTIIFRKRLPLFIGIGLSCSYLIWSSVAQAIQTQHFTSVLQQRGIDTSHSLTLAMPLNTMLWKNITMVEGGYWISFRSIFDANDAPIQSQFFSSDLQKLKPVADTESVKKLQAFTKGFYQVRETDSGIWMSDLRMGAFGNFVFNFRIAERNTVGAIVEPSEVTAKTLRAKGEAMTSALNRIKYRITDSEIDLFDLFDGAEMVKK